MLGTQYGFSKIEEYLESDGKKVPELAGKKKHKIGVLDLVKPIINLDGVLVGFQLRSELIRSVYMQSNYRFSELKRAIKLVIQLNQMVQNGEVEEFQIRSVKIGDEFENIEPVDVEIQVDKEELERNGLEERTSSEEDLDDSTIEQQVLKMLKLHAISVLTRTNPKRKGYYQLIWEEMDFEKLFEYKLDNVFRDQEH